MLINHAFFSQHWQRKPLLLRQTVRLPENSPDKKLLFSLAGDENTSGRLTFEIYRSDHNTIYQREIY